MRATIHSRLQPNAKELPIFWGHGKGLSTYSFALVKTKLAELLERLFPHQPTPWSTINVRPLRAS